jgi:hypothetical protein
MSVKVKSALRQAQCDKMGRIDRRVGIWILFNHSRFLSRSSESWEFE